MSHTSQAGSRRRHLESGAGAAEYAAIIVVVMAVAAAVVLAVSGVNVGRAVTCAVSSVFGDGSGCASADDGLRVDPADNVVQDESQTSTGGGSVGTDNPVFNVSAGFDDQGKTTYAQNEDGSGQYRVSDSKQGFVKGSVGKDDLKVGSVDVSLEASASGALTITDTTVYDCADPASCTQFGKDNAEEFDNRTRQGVSQIMGGGDTEVDGTASSYEHTTSGSIELSVKAGAEVDVDDSEISASAEGAASMTFEHTTTYAADDNGDKGDKTGEEVSTQYELNGSVGAAAEVVEKEVNGLEVEAHAGVTLSGGIGEEVTYKEDADGNLTELTFQTTSNWSSGSTLSVGVEGEDDNGDDTSPFTGAGETQVGYQYETTVTVDVTQLSDTDRKVVEGYVYSMSSKSPVLPKAALNPSVPADSDDALGTIIHEHAQVTTSKYEVASASAENEYDFVIAKYRSSQEYEHRRLVSQQYLQAPDGSGRRSYASTGAVD
ncbi:MULTISPECIES: hypothetical protein [unclassified Actinomyces]|uniref:hypothetical protein n=1 Tax=unclassified Actinomyces TaxID=2609248 RepID=UPI002016AC0E|nr:MULTISPECIES: hypothetical protein [unclassified Actinomyces]MCL3777081.1 hypothetical protein [Actinomyces sp. AC-20-1]MCL3789907.1 hypothetical protein [Actinomyces sp. 187325]MCL3792993.1 hypothetical protein [Actinomyces sp. 186855]MCL3795409.1 hypothetical protein [Actinomyces sp. 217892]